MITGMIYTTPPQHSTSNPTTAQVVNASPSQDLSQLTNGASTNPIQAIVLKHYVQQILNKNEQDKIVSDATIIDLQNNHTIVDHNGDTEQFAASLNKVPIADLLLTDLRANKITLNTMVHWQPSDVRAGEGAYDQPGAPTDATVHDLMFDMLNRSGNTAFRVLTLYGLGGPVTANSRIVSELNLHHTYLQPLPDDPTRFYLGNTTSHDSLAAIRILLSGNDSYQAFVKDALVTNIYTNYGVKSQLAGNDYIVLANKIGILDDPDGNNRHDTGIVYNTRTHQMVGYSLLNTAPGENYETPTAQAGASLADIGKGVLRYAGDKPVKTNAPQAMANQATPTPEGKLLF
jgi:beta-lactamase class A